MFCLSNPCHNVLTLLFGSYHYLKLDPDQASFDISKSPKDPFANIKNLFTSGTDADADGNAAVDTCGMDMGEKADEESVTDSAV